VYDIRLITEDDFKQFSQLVIDMYKAIDSSYSEFQALNFLLHENHAFEGFMAIGLFDNDKLVGFTFGRKFNKKSFYFSGIYVIIKNNEWTKKLIDFSFAKIKEIGYEGWVADASNSNIGSILNNKYGAVAQYTRYNGVL